MKACYLDCGAGVAGDMLLGAWIELGLSAPEVERVVKNVSGFKNWQLKISATQKQDWPCHTVQVIGDRPFGGPSKMKRAIHSSRLPASVKRCSQETIDALAWAEEQAHGHGPAHFDDQGIGLLDTLVDVVGSAWAIWKLGIEKITASSVNVGRIAPASARLIQRYRIPVYGQEVQHELATPTGLAILATTVGRFEPMPVIRLEKAGYGGGLRETPERPNVLGIHRYAETAVCGRREEVVQLETLIDDMDPRLYPYVAELLFKASALDVWWTPVGMKKGRPGIALNVLSRPERMPELLHILFRETTTLGVRCLPMERRVLERREGGLHKRALLPAGGEKQQAEFELAKTLARRRNVPLRTLL